jgi:FdhD protein
MNAGMSEVEIRRIEGPTSALRQDHLAVEEPLEIRLGCTIDGKRVHRPISVTMRTPGADTELAVGFLFTEGILTDRDQLVTVRGCGRGSSIRVELRPEVTVDLAKLDRHFYTSSSCGVCGKVSIESVKVAPNYRPQPFLPMIDAAVIQGLPRTLRESQAVFDQTGGLHASGLFDAEGRLIALREDVGRHNALDKLIGAQFLAGRTPLSESVLLVSGRASFELVQKAAVAGIPVLAAVGAPSSLAVELAREFGLTLVGFVREDRFNIYTGGDRICHDTQTALMPLALH